jgi:hypothetical protein
MRLPLKDIKLNPSNPRFIKDDKFTKLVQSLKDFPEMTEVREIVLNKEHVILGGNMRFRAMKEAGWPDAPVKIVDWPEDKQKEFMIKDNVPGGEWDWAILANEWDQEVLINWSLDQLNQFKPTLNPDSSLSSTTGAEVAKKEANLMGAFDGKEDTKKSIICPYCTEEFFVNE